MVSEDLNRWWLGRDDGKLEKTGGQSIKMYWGVWLTEVK